MTRKLALLAASATLIVIALPDSATAEQIEPARVEVVYAEPVPNDRFPNRTYFELSDGSTYRFVTYRACTKSDLPTRVCKTVFWYAR